MIKIRRTHVNYFQEYSCMAQQASNKKKQGPKVSPNFKPDNMTLEQWQVALRGQSAMKDTFTYKSITVE